MPVFHEDLFQVRFRWVVLFNERQNLFAFLWFLKEWQFPVFKLCFWEGPLKKILGITSFTWTWFNILDELFKYFLEAFVLRSLRVSPLTKPFLTPGGWTFRAPCTRSCLWLWGNHSFWDPRNRIRWYGRHRPIIQWSPPRNAPKGEWMGGLPGYSTKRTESVSKYRIRSWRWSNASQNRRRAQQVVKQATKMMRFVEGRSSWSSIVWWLNEFFDSGLVSALSGVFGNFGRIQQDSSLRVEETLHMFSLFRGAASWRPTAGFLLDFDPRIHVGFEEAGTSLGEMPDLVNMYDDVTFLQGFG